jgi:hypothetical protein
MGHINKPKRSKKMEALPFNPKTINFGDKFLHFWYANNAGRGANNCTIILSTSENRANKSAEQAGIISKTKTSAWKGKVNFSKSVKDALGMQENIKQPAGATRLHTKGKNEKRKKTEKRQAPGKRQSKSALRQPPALDVGGNFKAD